MAITWMKNYSVHVHLQKKNAPVVLHSLPWDRISLWTAPMGRKHKRTPDYETYRAYTVYNIYYTKYKRHSQPGRATSLLGKAMTEIV